MATNTNTASVTLRHSLDNGSSLHTSTSMRIELATDFQGLGIEGKLGTYRDRHHEGHAVDGDGGDTAAGDLAGHGGSRQVHLGYQPTAVDIAETVGFARQRGNLQGQVSLGNGVFLFKLDHR